MADLEPPLPEDMDVTTLGRDENDFGDFLHVQRDGAVYDETMIDIWKCCLEMIRYTKVWQKKENAFDRKSTRESILWRPTCCRSYLSFLLPSAFSIWPTSFTFLTAQGIELKAARKRLNKHDISTLVNINSRTDAHTAKAKKRLNCAAYRVSQSCC